MALSETRVKNKIISIIEDCRLDEGNGDKAKDKFATDLANVIVEEIKELKINYTGGLTANGSPVVGALNATIS